MRVLDSLFLLIISLLSTSLTVKGYSSIQMSALWLYADFNMTPTQFDSDATTNEAAIISNLQCILRIPKHLIIFNYRTAGASSGVRVCVQILADTTSVRSEKREVVAQAMISAYQAAINEALNKDHFEPFSYAPLLGANMIVINSWVSTKTIAIVPTDTYDFSKCSSTIDHSGTYQSVFATSLNSTDYSYFTTGGTTVNGSNTQNNQKAVRAEQFGVSLVGLVMCIILNIFG